MLFTVIVCECDASIFMPDVVVTVPPEPYFITVADSRLDNIPVASPVPILLSSTLPSVVSIAPVNDWLLLLAL